MYFDHGIIACTPDDVETAKDFMARNPPNPAENLWQGVLEADAAFFCKALGTEIQPEDTTERGVARLKALYDEQMAIEQRNAMIAPFQQLKKEIQALRAQEQFEELLRKP